MHKMIIAAGAAMAAAVTLMAAPAASASATHSSGCAGYSAGHSWYVHCQNGGGPGSGGGSSSSSSSSQHCFWTTNIDHYFPDFIETEAPLPKGYMYIYGPVCPGYASATTPTPLVYVVRKGGHLTPQDLAQQAYAELRPPLPDPQTAPPRGSDGLVGLPEWFWVPAGHWAPHTVRIAVGPVWAAVTATPAKLIFSPGDRLSPLTCPGPGVAYDPAKPASAQSSPCTYTYTHSSDGLAGNAYTARVSIQWTATWAGSGGTGGTLPALTTTSTFTLPVAEAQALTGTGG